MLLHLPALVRGLHDACGIHKYCKEHWINSVFMHIPASSGGKKEKNNIGGQSTSLQSHERPNIVYLLRGAHESQVYGWAIVWL